MILNLNFDNMTFTTKEEENYMGTIQNMMTEYSRLAKHARELEAENALLKHEKQEAAGGRRKIITEIFEAVSRAQEASREAQPFAISPLVKTRLKEIEYAAGDAKSLLRRLD